MIKDTNYVPNPRYLLSLRDHGYNFDNAFRELCDNSFDALIGTKNKKIIAHFNFEEDYMFLSDNGCGMKLETLQEALRLGSETGKNSANGEEFGHYGSGLKAACMSLGSRFTLITKHADDKYYTAIYDRNLGIANDTWDFPEVRESTNEEITKLLTYGSKPTGTYLEVSSLEGVKNKNSQSITSQTVRKIGEFYRYYITTKEKDGKTQFHILSGKKQKPILIEPIDPMCVNLKNNIRLNSDEENRYTVTVHGVEVEFYIDFYHISSDAKAANGDKRGDNPVEPNITNQGIYVLRNNRQIIRAKTLEMFSKHNDMNNFRAELRYDSKYDRFFGMDNKKIHIDPAQAILDKIRKDVKTFTNESRLLHKKATIAKTIGELDDDMKNIIQEDGTNPNFPKHDAGIEIPPPVAPPEPTTTRKGGGGRPKGSKNQPYTITLVSDGSKGNFFTPIYKGGSKYELQINTDHKFYAERYLKLNKIGKKTLVDLVYSVTLAQFNTLYDIIGKVSDFNGDVDHDDKHMFINNFMDSWSDYLRDKIYR